MERIKGKFDDVENKARPGSFWVAGHLQEGRTDMVRFVDPDGSEMWFNPTSRYYAATPIKRGQAVSIAQLSDLTEEQRSNKYFYVKVTNPDVDEICLGIAQNYAEEGQIVHVQSKGQFNYYTTSSKYYTEERRKKEIFLNADGWNFDKVRGQRLYIKKVYTSTENIEENAKKDVTSQDDNPELEGKITEDKINSRDITSDRFDTDHIDQDNPADDTEFFTYDFIDSIYNTKNTFQIGYLVDAPTEKKSEDDFVVTIELDVTGDTRGPIDNTQFILTLGEDIFFETSVEKYGHKDVALYEPHNNEGIYDEVKVLAIAEGHPRTPAFNMFSLAQATTPLENAFISFRKLDGNTYIIPVLCNSVDFDSLIDPTDEGYYKLSKSFIQDGKHKIIVGDPITVLNRDNLKESMKKAFENVFEVAEDDEEPLEVLTQDIGENGFCIYTNKVGGYYDVYLSDALTSLVSTSQVEHGQTADEGEAILADIRDAGRLNIAGVVVSNQSGVHKKGETIKVMKMGRLVTIGNFKPGKQYYLGLNGRLTTKAQYWYDHCVMIGTADSMNYFIVDCSQPLHNYSGNFPLGYIKPSIAGIPEKGFCLADGLTSYPKEQYSELYHSLLNWFTEDELKPSKVSSEKISKGLLMKYYEPVKNLTEALENLAAKDLEQDELFKATVDQLNEKNAAQDVLIQEAEETNDINLLRKDMESEVARLEEHITQTDSNIRTLIQTQIEEVDEKINTLRGEIESMDSATAEKVEVLTNSLKELLNSINNSNEQRMLGLQNSIDGVRETLNTALTDVKSTNEEGFNKVASLQNELQTTNQSLKEGFNNVDNLKTSMEGIIQELKNTVQTITDNSVVSKIEVIAESLNNIKTTLVVLNETLSKKEEETPSEETANPENPSN